MSNRIYVAGGMRGYPELNFPAFNEATKGLTEAGWEVVNPVNINPDPNTPYAECMRKDIAELVTCDAIYMLHGWADSKGATMEYSIAECLEMDIYFQDVDYTDDDEDDNIEE